jgi:hypothetical protein
MCLVVFYVTSLFSASAVSQAGVPRKNHIWQTEIHLAALLPGYSEVGNICSGAANEETAKECWPGVEIAELNFWWGGGGGGWTMLVWGGGIPCQLELMLGTQKTETYQVCRRTPMVHDSGCSVRHSFFVCRNRVRVCIWRTAQEIGASRWPASWRVCRDLAWYLQREKCWDIVHVDAVGDNCNTSDAENLRFRVLMYVCQKRRAVSFIQGSYFVWQLSLFASRRKCLCFRSRELSYCNKRGDRKCQPVLLIWSNALVQYSQDGHDVLHIFITELTKIIIVSSSVPWTSFSGHGDRLAWISKWQV